MDTALYIATVLGAVALLMMMPGHRRPPRIIGAILGGMTLGGVWLYLARLLPDGGTSAPMAYYYVFSTLAIIGAVRVITHPKPVYSALWFIMVVLSSAGLFLVLEAEFMAIAMVIIYGGAILVTYVFVIMLAAHSGDPQVNDAGPPYDRIARQPVGAISAGFLLMAVLLSLASMPVTRAPAVSDVELIRQGLTQRPIQRMADRLGEPAFTIAPALKPNSTGLPPLREAFVRHGRPLSHQASVQVQQPGRRWLVTDTGKLPEVAPLAFVVVADPQHDRLAVYPFHPALANAERVGMDLFRSHPLGLELAGVILLVAMVGAVIIARQHVDAEPAEPVQTAD